MSGTTREIVKQLEGYASTLTQSMRVMDERRYILEPLLYHDGIKSRLSKKFNNTYGARAYNHLLPLLAQDLVRELARLYLDEDKRACSFSNIYRKASVPKIYHALKNKFSKIPDKWNDHTKLLPGLSEESSKSIIEEWRNKDRSDFSRSFEKGWGIATQAIDDLKNDLIASKVKTFRDKYHAHLEMTPLGQDPSPFDVKSLKLTYNEILEFHAKYVEAVFELTRILTGSVHDIDGFTKIHKESGEDMWLILSGVKNNATNQA